jgi:hypothetical protein
MGGTRRHITKYRDLNLGSIDLSALYTIICNEMWDRQGTVLRTLSAVLRIHQLVRVDEISQKFYGLLIWCDRVLLKCSVVRYKVTNPHTHTHNVL